MKVLITGFEPFKDLKTNSSEELVNALLEETFDFELAGTILPVSFKRAFTKLELLINEYRPDYVVSFGVATERTVITPERIAINFRKSEYPDNDGYAANGEIILDGSEDGLFTSLPVDEMVNACMAKGIDAKVSLTAGTYVCNDLMYKLMKKSRELGFKASFIHVPPIAGTKGSNSTLNLEELKVGVFEMLNYLFTA